MGPWRARLARRPGEPWQPDALAAVEKAEADDDAVGNRRAYGRSTWPASCGDRNISAAVAAIGSE